jgi:hypothetical protein
MGMRSYREMDARLHELQPIYVNSPCAQLQDL